MNNISSSTVQCKVLGKAFEVNEIELPELGPTDLLIKVAASGICHTDVSGRDTGMANPPSVFGHEGAGIVEETGSEVTDLQKGIMSSFLLQAAGHVIIAHPVILHIADIMPI